MTDHEMTDHEAAELLELLRRYVAEYPEMAQHVTADVITDLKDSIAIARPSS